MNSSKKNSIFTKSKNQEAKLKELRRFLRNTSLPPYWELEIDSKGQLLLHIGEGHPFKPPVSSLYPPSRSQALVRAVGFKNKPLSILDVTAGWGKDAYLLCQMGCHVRGIESHKLVFAFLKDLRKDRLCQGTLEFILGNSLSYLKKIKEKPDVIYFDPLFPKEKKSLSSKPLRILQELTFEEQTNYQDFFEICLKKAKRRVVMKRHRLQKSMKGNRLCTFSGRSICFDVFAPVTI